MCHECWSGFYNLCGDPQIHTGYFLQSQSSFTVMIASVLNEQGPKCMFIRTAVVVVLITDVDDNSTVKKAKYYYYLS